MATIATKSKSPPEAKTKSNLQQQSKTSPNKTGGSLLVASGLPTDALGEGLEWPKGWTKIKKQRLGGASAGTFDCYWISPILKFRLRSLPEVRKFLRALQANGGDEVLAKKIVKRKTPKQEKQETDKDDKARLGKRKENAGKSPNPKGDLRPKERIPSTAVDVSADKPSSMANKSPHTVATKKARVSKPKMDATVTDSEANGSSNIQKSLNRNPIQPTQAAVAVAAKISELMALSEKNPDTIATSTVPTKNTQNNSQQQRGGQLSKQLENQKTTIPDAQGRSLECPGPVSDQNQDSSVISGDSEDFDDKIGFSEYHIEL